MPGINNSGFEDGLTLELENGLLVPYAVDLLRENDELTFPVVILDVNLPGMINLPDLNVSNVVDALETSLGVFLGDGEDDTVESCSGGILGLAIGGRSIFNYQIPGKNACFPCFASVGLQRTQFSPKICV